MTAPDRQLLLWSLTLFVLSTASNWFFDRLMLYNSIVADRVIPAFVVSVLIFDVVLAALIAKNVSSYRILIGLTACFAAMVLEYHIMLFVVLAVVFSHGA